MKKNLTLSFVLFIISIGTSQVIKLNGEVSAENNLVKNLADPVDDQDAVTKAFLQAKIDELTLRIENLEKGILPDSPIVFSLSVDRVTGYSTLGNYVTAYAINGNIIGSAEVQTENNINYVILDDFTDDVPTGTNYQELMYYDTYSDAGSIDGSRFEINRLTTDFTVGGILFYGTLELNSQSDANVFRLTDSSGLPFKFNSFRLDYLEEYGAYFQEFIGSADPGKTVEIYIGDNLFSSTVADENGEWKIPFDTDNDGNSDVPEGCNSISISGGEHYGPSLKVTFSNGYKEIYRSLPEGICHFDIDGYTRISFPGYNVGGTKSFSQGMVDWVDFESHYTKAKIIDINLDQLESNFDISFNPPQIIGNSILLSSTDQYGTESERIGITIE